MFWIACPEAPLTRLSVTASTMARPAMRSGNTPMTQWLEPRTCRVDGLTPAGATCTKGS